MAGTVPPVASTILAEGQIPGQAGGGAPPGQAGGKGKGSGKGGASKPPTQTPAGPRPEQVLSQQLSQPHQAGASRCSGQGQTGQVPGTLLEGSTSIPLEACQATCRKGRSAVRGRGQSCGGQGHGLQRALRGSEKLRALPEEPVPEPAKSVSQAGPAPAELKLLLAY
eukprot:1619686-Amphidinium_carterae.2